MLNIIKLNIMTIYVHDLTSAGFSYNLSMCTFFHSPFKCLQHLFFKVLINLSVTTYIPPLRDEFTFQYHCHGIMTSMIYCTINYPDLLVPCLVYDQSDVEKSVEKVLKTGLVQLVMIDISPMSYFFEFF